MNKNTAVTPDLTGPEIRAIIKKAHATQSLALGEVIAVGIKKLSRLPVRKVKALVSAG